MEGEEEEDEVVMIGVEAEGGEVGEDDCVDFLPWADSCSFCFLNRSFTSASD